AVASGRRLVLLTAHRRENWGAPMERVFRAARELLERHEDVVILFPVHKNPVVREPAYRELGRHPRAALVEPLSYADMVHALKAADLVLTDSGGLQEEAPALGKPVLVLRETTERPEGVLAEIGRASGRERVEIATGAGRLTQ